MFPFKFILNKEIMEEYADGTIFEAMENADCLTINVSWIDESGLEDNVDYMVSEVEDNIDKKIWIIVE